MSALRSPVLLLVALALAACGGEPQTPEAQVRATLGALEEAAEAGDVGAFKDAVSERYADPMGHDKQKLAAYITFHVLRNQRGREVLMRVRDVRIVEPARAAVVLHVGLAGSGGSLVRANVYEVQMDLAREEDEWRLVWAEWRPAPPASLL